MEHADHVGLLRPAGLAGGGVWADFGAGSGAFTLALRDLTGPQVELYAIDKDAARLAELKRSYEARFGPQPDYQPGAHAQDRSGMRLLRADIRDPLSLPPLDGVLMANSLHYFKDKVKILRQIGAYLKPAGQFLLVEYNADSGNVWVPYPLSFKSFQALAPQVGFSPPRSLAAVPSRFLGEIYSALTHKAD